MEEHREELFSILEQLQEAEYRAIEKKSEFSLKETISLGHEITEHGIKPKKEKIGAIVLIKPPTSIKEL